MLLIQSVVHIFLKGIADLGGGFPQQPDSDAAGEDANGVGNKVKRVRFPVGGEDALRGFGKGGKGQA